MKSRASALITLALLAGVTPTGECFAQALPDSVVERIRTGAVRLVLPGDSVALPLVGTPTLPLVEVSVNETGPYRFLIDLGSNVTVLRRNVVDASRSTVLVERATSDIVYVKAIALGAARLEGVTVASYDELDVDGVLGYNVLQYSSFTLDFPGQRLVLHRDSLPTPDDRTVFSYRLVGRLPYITVRLGHDSLLVEPRYGCRRVDDRATLLAGTFAVGSGARSGSDDVQQPDRPYTGSGGPTRRHHTIRRAHDRVAVGICQPGRGGRMAGRSRVGRRGMDLRPSTTACTSSRAKSVIDSRQVE